MHKAGLSRFTVLITFAACSVTPAAGEAGWTEALARRDVGAIGRLAAGGADVNQAARDGLTALMVAAAKRDRALLRELLVHGAKVDAANDRGGTALMYAASAGDDAAVSLLLAHGARPDARAANGWTALTLGAALGFDRVVSLLLARGADPNVADIYGWTPLMRAVDRERANVVAVLLDDPRIDLEAVDERGLTALDHANELGLGGIARMLLARGARAPRGARPQSESLPPDPSRSRR